MKKAVGVMVLGAAVVWVIHTLWPLSILLIFLGLALFVYLKFVRGGSKR